MAEVSVFDAFDLLHRRAMRSYDFDPGFPGDAIACDAAAGQVRAALQPRRCDGCRFWRKMGAGELVLENGERTRNFGACSVLRQHWTTPDWFCADWQPKEAP